LSAGKFDISATAEVVALQEGLEHGQIQANDAENEGQNRAPDGANLPLGGASNAMETMFKETAAGLRTGSAPDVPSKHQRHPIIEGSRFYGTVCSDPHTGGVGTWISYVIQNGRPCSLGAYDTEEVAALVRDFHLVRVHEFTNQELLNFGYLIPQYRQLQREVMPTAPTTTSMDYKVAAQRLLKVATSVPAPLGWRTPLNRKVDCVGMGTARGPKFGNAFATRSKNSDACCTQILERTVVDQQPRNKQTIPPPRIAPTARVESPASGSLRAEAAHASIHRDETPHPVCRASEPRTSNAATLVRLEPSIDAVPKEIWRLNYVICPATATVRQLKEAIACGLQEQHMIEFNASMILLDAASDLDANTESSKIYESDSSSRMKVTCLRENITMRELVLLLADGREDLQLTYAVISKRDSQDL